MNKTPPLGNPNHGLLKDIIDLINELGPDETYRPEEITKELMQRGKDHDLQTVGSYFSTNNPGIFYWTDGAEYGLSNAHQKPNRPEK